MKQALLIDDDPSVRTTLARLLPALGFSVTQAESGFAGLAALKEGKPDVIITDIIMPDMDGIELVINIRRDDRKTPIIAISGGGRIANIDFLRMAQGLGATKILPKPFGVQQLRDVLSSCFEEDTSSVS